MSERPAVDDAHRLTSPWPVFVAMGLAVTEVGVLFGFLFVSIGGILLFGRSCAGILAESGYAESVYGGLAVIGGLFALGGVGIWTLGAMPWESIATLLRAPWRDGVAFRGAAILCAGGLLALAGAFGSKLPGWLRTPS